MGIERSDRGGLVFLISTPSELSVLSSPVRSEVLEVMMHRGSATIAEVATVMGRSPESLHHHFKLLQRIGVVEVVEVRKGAGRPERVFALQADDFRIDYSNRSKPFREALKKASRSMLHLAQRELESSIDRRRRKSDDGDAPRYRIGRNVVRLTREHRRALHDRLTELHEWLGEVDATGAVLDGSGGDAEGVVLTFVLGEATK